MFFLLCSVFESNTVSAGQLIFTNGPSGGTGGGSFKDSSIPPDSRVVEVRIRAERFVNSLQIIYEKGGKQPEHGGKDGRRYSFKLDRFEYITGISGKYGRFIESIRIHTNKQISRRFGGRVSRPS